MNPKPMIDARTILRAIQQVRRQGIARTIQALEQQETELANFLMEEFSDIYRKVLDLGGPAKPSQAVEQQIQAMALVIVQAMQRQRPSRKERRRNVAHRDRKNADS